MADSAPDPKVEDVLSSVRRLVSQEIPKREAPKPMAPESGALVLTSQDRIEADPKTRHDTRSLEERIAELEAAVDSTTGEFEPDGSEDQAQHRPDRIVFSRPRPDADARRRRSTLRLSEIALIETGPASEGASNGDVDETAQVAFRHEPSRPRPKGDTPKGETPDAAPNLPDEAPMAEDVPTLPASSAELRAFSDDPDDVVARIEARIERGGDTPSAPPPERVTSRPAPKADDDESFSAALTAAIAASKADTEGESDKTVTSAEPAAPETATEAPKSNAAELDVSGPAGATRRAQLVRDAAVSRPIVLQEQTAPEKPEAEVASHPASATEADENSVSDTTTPESKAEAALDALPAEDALRLLVGRLMREELQGQLGERMTRNIRKLVQREVKRVLETRSLD